MDKEKQKEFVRRVSQANRTELVVVTYDILLEELEEAAGLYGQGDIEAYRRELKSAQRYIGELMSTLDYSFALSRQLLSLYEYVQRVVIKCDVGGKPENLDSAVNVIKGLRKAFAQVAAGDRSEPLMSNIQSVYAGLTYGRKGFNETSIDPGNGRGFLA